MSLINQMLQDLDARRATHSAETRLPNDVRPLPVESTSRWPWMVGAVVVAGGLGAAFWWRTSDSVLEVPPQTRVAVSPSLVQIPAPQQPPAEKDVASVAAPSEQSEAAVAPTAARDSAALNELQLAMSPSLDMAQPSAHEDTPAMVGAVDKEAKTETGAASRSTAPDKKPRTPDGTKIGKPVQTEPAAASAAAGGAATRSAASKVVPAIERTEVLGSGAERAESAYRKAIAAVNQGRVGEAIDGLRAALKADAQHVASRQLMVKLLLETRQADEAMVALDAGLQQQPDQVAWAMTLARLQVDHGDLNAAWLTLERSAPAASASADYQGFAGHVLMRLGRNRDALSRYQLATRLNPGDGRWWLGLGLSLESDGKASEAREAFMHARQCGNLSRELLVLVEQKLR